VLNDIGPDGPHQVEDGVSLSQVDLAQMNGRG
jgi:hypothetical protein